MIQVDSLRKTFSSSDGRVQAVNGISFQVPTGEFFTLLGPSGCGKTTTLRCLAGLERPDSGEIRLGDETVFSSRTRTFVPTNQRSIGVVFQSYAIWPHMTVFDNVAYPLRARRRPRQEVQQKAMEALELVGMAHLANRPAPRLSGGQQQRVALARAIVFEPTVLLLDEPLSNLDAQLRAQMRSELKQLQRKVGITAVYVTHDQQEALALSDTVAVMNQGAIVQLGTPEEIYLAPRDHFTASFIGTTNLLEGRVGRHLDGDVVEVETQAGVIGTRLVEPSLRDAGRVAVSIRPEAIAIGVEAPSSAAATNTLRGRISHVQFLGETVEYVVQVGDVAFHVRGSPFRRLAQGDEVVLTVPVELCTAVRAASPTGIQK
jgi:iron(III) transport system ATP-binding protein